MEPCGTTIIVCIHELKTESSLQFNCLNHGLDSQMPLRDP